MTPTWPEWSPCTGEAREGQGESVKISILGDEMYPVFFESEYGTEFEIADEIVARFRNIEKEYYEMQDIIQELVMEKKV
ncbi:MAG: hypothetical protein NTW84_02930 [Methanothrix sp.]|nr:hypothetical protein [Methanothrix sp.]